MQSLDFTAVNEMLREMYVNDILPKKAKKNPLRGYRSEAAMTTTTTTKRSGKKRDRSEVVCHSCGIKGHHANKCPAKKLLPGDTTTKWGSLHKTRSHSHDECMAPQATPQSASPVSALPATISCATETCSFYLEASSPFLSINKGRLQLLVDRGCLSDIVDPDMIPNTDQYLREYQALQPPNVFYVAGSHQLLATGTAKLAIGFREQCKQTTRGEHVCCVGTWSWSQSAVFVSCAGKQGRDDNICVSCAERKVRTLLDKTRP